MNGYGSYQPRHLSGEMYVPFVVGSGFITSTDYFAAVNYFSADTTYAKYPGFFTGYAYAFGEYNQSAISSAYLSYARYSYLSACGRSNNHSSNIGKVTTAHTETIKHIGYLH